MKKRLHKRPGHYRLGTAALALAGVLSLAGGCRNCPQGKPDAASTEDPMNNPVIETIMARRSIRKYRPDRVEPEKLDRILECGIHAPNGMARESWQIRVVTDPELLREIGHPFQPPVLIFIAYDRSYDLSQVDCGLLGGNIILSAQSMGLGTCCLGGLIREMKSPEKADLLARLALPDTHELLYAIALGYPDETPAAKPRHTDRIRFL